MDECENTEQLVRGGRAQNLDFDIEYVLTTPYGALMAWMFYELSCV
jgi:hypothetical protein